MKPDVVVLGRFWHETGTRLASRYECRHNLLAWCQGSSPVRGWLLTMAVACSGCCTSLPYEPIGGNRYTVKGSLRFTSRGSWLDSTSTPAGVMAAVT